MRMGYIDYFYVSIIANCFRILKTTDYTILPYPYRIWFET